MELLGLYDEMGNYTGDKIDRMRKNEVPPGRFFRIVIIFIQNRNGEFLIQKVSKSKGSEYATTGGHVQDGSSSIDTVKQEVREELGISLANDDIKLFEIERYPLAFQDCYYVKKDIDTDTVKLQTEEVESVEWLSAEKINFLIDMGEFRKGNIEPFYDLMNILKSQQDFENPIYKIVNSRQKRKL